jgi:Protein phosphatase 2C
MTQRRWCAAAASVIGNSHSNAGIACQDKFLCTIVESAAENEILIAVVADGAGSAPRSDEGADLACIVLRDAVQLYLALGGQISGITHETVQNWVALVQRRLCEQAVGAGAPIRDYACTLLVAVVGADCAAFLQIGDGAIVVSDNELGWRCVFWPQKGEFANITNFVTQEDAVSRVEFISCEIRIEDIAIFTDGIEDLVLRFADKAAHRPFFDQMFATMHKSSTDGFDESLAGALATYLSSSQVCERTDDDKTLVLASRRLGERACPPQSDEVAA